MAAKPPRPARAETAVAVLPRPAAPRRVDLTRLLPSGRSAAIALLVAALGLGGYFLARESSLFVVQRIEVVGAPPAVAAQVRKALESFEGASLLTLDGTGVQRRLAELPEVAAARYDRDFPHTLQVLIRPEHPVVVLRRGTESWLISARGRVVARLDRGTEQDFPRLWLDRSVAVSLGSTLSGNPRRAVQAVTPLAGTAFARRVRTVRATDSDLTLVLRTGLELRLGDTRNLVLKLAVGKRVAGIMGPGPGYIDLTVPGRPVASKSLKSKL